MLNRSLPHLTKSITTTIVNPFGVGKLILHYIRTVLNRIRWEENRELHSLQSRSTTLPRNTEQANKLFVATEQDLSLSEQARMQRIDRILGTRTFFHQTKPYQERLDSEHIMDLEELKRSNRQPSRKTLDWLNPKIDVKVQYKNKRKYYSYISKLRTYPKHDNVHDFLNENNENTIKFLGKEAVYSKISMKSVELSVESLENESIGLGNERPFQGEKFTYFRPTFSMQLFRIQKKMYTAELASDEKAFLSKQTYIQEVISLDQIYETLKDYDLDERVSEYLRKVENNRLQYLFSEFTYDANENVVAVMIDLLGTMKEYCLLVKSMTAESGQKMRAIFNIRPQAIFSADGQHICYVQRSPQGGWIELAYRSVQSCWQRKGELALLEDSQEILYRCGAEKELRLGTDSKKNYIFLTIQDYGKEYSESLFIVEKRQEEGLALIQLDSGYKCQYYYDVSPLGVILARFQVASDPLKYGRSDRVASSVQLVPYKQHLQVVSEQKIGISDGLLPPSAKSQVIPPSEFDTANKKTIYTAGQGEFIRQIETRSTHLIMVLNIAYVYDRAILYLLPFKPTAHPHSLILSGGANLTLRAHTFTYNSQIVEFSKPVGCILVQKSYNIWKKELIDVCDTLKRYHYQRILVSNQDQYPLQISVLCRDLYTQVPNLPVLIYFPSGSEDLQGTALRQLLEKGIMVVQFLGRGTFSRDAQHYLSGCRQNFPNLMDDLQSVVEFIGNGMSKNISIYCKGESSSLVGLWFNVYFPYLFNATVLHNGLYDLEERENGKLWDFFGNIKQGSGWEAFNIYKHRFKQPTLTQTQDKQSTRSIGTLENIIISSDKTHRLQSRKLIHRLRQNQSFTYEQVYLKQYENHYETDLHNLAYLYSKIRTRLQQQINTPIQE